MHCGPDLMLAILHWGFAKTKLHRVAVACMNQKLSPLALADPTSRRGHSFAGLREIRFGVLARLGWGKFACMTLTATRKAPPQNWLCFQTKELLRGTLLNRTYGAHKTYIFRYFYQQYLVLFTMVPRNSVVAPIQPFHDFFFIYHGTWYTAVIPVDIPR